MLWWNFRQLLHQCFKTRWKFRQNDNTLWTWNLARSHLAMAIFSVYEFLWMNWEHGNITVWQDMIRFHGATIRNCWIKRHAMIWNTIIEVHIFLAIEVLCCNLKPQRCQSQILIYLFLRCFETSRFESCIQQRKTTCLLSIRKSLACASAPKYTTTNMYIVRARCESQTAMKSSRLNAHSSLGRAVEFEFLAWGLWVGFQSAGE